MMGWTELRRTWKAAGLVAMALVFVVGLGCAAGNRDFTITSSVDEQHSHRVAIAGADVDNPPAEKTITTSSEGSVPHVHTIILTRQSYESLRAGAEVIVISSPFLANNHTHTFAIKKSASSGSSGY